MTSATHSSPASVQVGSIMVASWGYEQTNIDFYRVQKLTETNGQRWVTLQALKGQVTHYDPQAMAGTKIPSAVAETTTTLRRKLVMAHRREGFSIHRRYGWCSLWDGTPQRYTTYG